MSQRSTGDDSQKSQTPGSLMPPPKRRPSGMKLVKEKVKKRGEAGSYLEIMRKLILLRKKDLKLREERWRHEKMVAEREVSLAERKLSLVKKRLAWEQEQHIMFCDVSTLEPDMKTRVLAKRAQIAASAVAALHGGFGGANDAFAGSSSSFGGELGGGVGNGGFSSGSSNSGNGGEGNSAEMSSI